MGKVTQQERHERKKRKQNKVINNKLDTYDDANLEEPKQKVTSNIDDNKCCICMLCMDETDIMTLECGHSFHKECANEWFGTQIRNKVEDNGLNLMTPLPQLPNGDIGVIVHLEDNGIITCACCRTEYTILGHKVGIGELIPQKIIAKVRFAEVNGVKPVHYITRLSELVHYTPKTLTKNIDLFEFNYFTLERLMEDIVNNKNTELDATICSCNNKACPGLFLMNEKLWQVAKEGKLNAIILRAASVDELHNALAPTEEINKMIRRIKKYICKS